MIDDDEQREGEPSGAPAPGEPAPAPSDAAGVEDRSEAAAASDGALAAREAERLLARRSLAAGAAGRRRFVMLVALALLAHVALIAVLLWRDRRAEIQIARSEEVPVEVVVEPPKPPEPEAPKPPPPPKPPEPPKPKEDLSPALSAPRAENKDPLKTDKLQEKTSVPKAAQPPSEGQPSPKTAAAAPAQAAPEPQQKPEEAAKEEVKPDAEALDKAAPKPVKQAAPKATKPAPKQKKAPDMMASLSGLSSTPEISFAKPTPQSKVYGGTEDVRWMSTVEGMLESKVAQLPRTAHFQEGGQVLICFHVDVSGRVTVKEYCRKSGYPDVDALAMRALVAAAPFPPPPPGIERGLIWSSVFDGQLPHVHISKR